MPFQLCDFQRCRPFLFHLTARNNLASILRSGSLSSAASLFAEAARPELLTRRRPECCEVDIRGARVVIRDQAPLHPGNMRLDEGWSFETLVAHLNAHVFFWPGTASGPIESGRRHFARYRRDDVVVLRLPTQDTISSNIARPPLFSPYNSGSPRCTGGRGSPRGASTFRQASDFPRSAGAVIECVYRDCARLPASAEVLEISAL